MGLAMRRRFPTTRPSAPSAWVVALALGMAGCGASKSDLPLTPAVGKVTLDGNPLAEAVLSFTPIGATRGQGGSATTDAEGRYGATSATGEPGLPAGEYQVIISKQELPKGAAPPPEGTTRADSPYQETLPRAYSDSSLTKLTAKVAEGGESVNDFELKAKSR